MARVAESLQVETGAAIDAVGEVVALYDRLRSRPGADYRDLEARIRALEDGALWRDASMTQLDAGLFALGAPSAVAAILRDARQLGA